MNNLLLQSLERQKKHKEVFFNKNKIYPRLQITEERQKIFENNSLVKIITGPRRAGKSTFLMSLLKNRDFIYVNFDDIEILNYYSGINELLDLLKILYGDIKTVLFDEIQNIDGWPLILNQMHREGYNVYVTGSNSKLFSTEFASSLTGRHMTMDLFGFNYVEYLSVKEGEENTEGIINFMYKGGFPEIITNNVDIDTYIDILLKNIIYKDVAVRHNLRQPSKVDLLVRYLVSNVTGFLNFEAIVDILKIKGYKTILKYLDYIEESYTFLFLQPFSFKARERLSFDRKIFSIDNSFLKYKSIPNSFNRGAFFENLIFTELIKKGYEINANLFYYNTKKNYGIDFCIKGARFNQFKLIQVCYEMSMQKTEDREVRALIDASKELKCDDLYIITLAEKRTIEKEGKSIKVIPFKEFCELWERAR